MKKNRPYKYNSKSRLTPDSQSFPFKVNTIKNDVVTNLENTLTKLHIIEETSEEKELLDDGFLEGRVDRKEEKKKHKKPKVQKETKEKKSLSDKEKMISKLEFSRKLVLSISAVGAILFVVMTGYRAVSKTATDFFHSAKNRIIIEDKKNSHKVDDNYVFVGDFHTNQFSFEKYGLDYHYVKVSKNSLTTDELLNHMKEMVYDYNPSVVFIEIGLMDIDNDVNANSFIQNYSRIIDYIEMNRPYATIIVESIYPVNEELYDHSSFNRTIKNKDIEKYNESLRSIVKEKNVEYIDIYAQLLKDGQLNSKYTNDGVTLNEVGYQEVYNEIKKVVG